MRTPNYRARLVGREVAYDKTNDLYAVIPPLESVKVVMAVCASSQQSFRHSRVMALDAIKVYVYALTSRAVHK